MAAGAAGGALLGFYATAWEPFRLRVCSVPVRLGDGGGPVLKLAQISDLHVHRRPQQSALARAIPILQGLGADLIAITGDLVESTSSDAAGCMALLDELEAPLGVYACPGTHEYLPEGGPPPELFGGSLEVLSDRSVPLTHRGASFWLGGFDDATYTDGNFDRTFRDVPPGATTILLSHSPDHIYDAAERGIDLMLSGHTHGGQLCLPGIGALMTNTRYGRRFAHGLFRVGPTQMYVNAGLGTVIARVRFLCPPEITLLSVELPAP